ncbi:MAG TPA: SGNH/GDSL hydrolase family protein [Acidimicrobiales bacterium]|nr:SGNH/GDSL hydrolase family protein [Acidimicrobiales bacterium]
MHHHRVVAKTVCVVALVAGTLTGVLGLSQMTQAAASPNYYVSLGDSYSVGYQPGRGATPGYTSVAAKATRLRLVNFGCGGATTTSLVSSIGCPDVLPHTAGAMTYPTTTQEAAAVAFLTAHRGHIGLITVSIGGNDVTACAAQANPIPCVVTAVAGITKNVTSLVQALRTAAGPRVPLIGLTYPDVILGSYVYPKQPAPASAVSLANVSVTAFKSFINPALSKAYAAGNGSLVDVTKATGAYVPLTRTVRFRPYGIIPAAVASVCNLTWFCAQGNIHATTKGYTFIGKLVAARYAAMHRP